MTSAVRDYRVQKSDLGQLTEIGSGGQALIYLVSGYRLPGLDGQLVFKQYRKKVLKAREPAIRNGMAPLILFPDKLSSKDSQFLSQRTVWPRALVVNGNQEAVGILMKIIPDTFFFDMTLPGGKERKPLELQHFYRTDAQKRSLNIPVLSDTDKMQFVIRTIQTVEFFHRNDLVIGDFSPRNLMLSHPDKLSGVHKGKIFPKFLDVDSYRFVGGQPPLEQMNTPTCFPPEIRAAEERLKALQLKGAPQGDILAADARRKKLTTKTDVFKLGLATLRLFHSGEEAIAVYISPEGRSRITRLIGAHRAKVVLASLEENPDNRPTTTEMLKLFQGQGP